MSELDELREVQTASREIFDGKIMHVFEVTVRLPDGNAATREYMRHIGAVCVIPVLENGDVLVERQYLYPVGQVLTEIPAGKLEPGEHSEEHFADAARRELREETGAVCDRLTFIGDFYSSPAILDEVIHMNLAEGLHMGEASPDDDEFLNLISMPLDALCDMAARGEITDGKTQAAVLKVRYIIDKRSKKQ